MVAALACGGCKSLGQGLWVAAAALHVAGAVVNSLPENRGATHSSPRFADDDNETPCQRQERARREAEANGWAAPSAYFTCGASSSRPSGPSAGAPSDQVPAF